MNILIVGAGAVGQVYGYHFQQQGHQVTFLIKEKYQAELSEGMTLYHLNKDKSLENPISFQQYQLVTAWPDHKDHHFDVIVLSIPSTALRHLPFADVERCCNQKTPILMLQPSAEDFAILSRNIPGVPLAEGLISLIAYQTPLIDNRNQQLSQQPDKRGIAYYLPPMAMPVSSNNKQLARQLTALFSDSQIKARVSRSAIADSKLPSAFLMTFLCALEAADWKLEQLSRNKALLTELTRAQHFFLPTRLPQHWQQLTMRFFITAALRPITYRLLIRIAPSLLPLPLEAYLKSHFSKVRQQTLLYMQDYIKEIPDQRLIQLLQRIDNSAAMHTKND